MTLLVRRHPRRYTSRRVCRRRRGLQLPGSEALDRSLRPEAAEPSRRRAFRHDQVRERDFARARAARRYAIRRAESEAEDRRQVVAVQAVDSHPRIDGRSRRHVACPVPAVASVAARGALGPCRAASPVGPVGPAGPRLRWPLDIPRQQRFICLQSLVLNECRRSSDAGHDHIRSRRGMHPRAECQNQRQIALVAAATSTLLDLCRSIIQTLRSQLFLYASRS